MLYVVIPAYNEEGNLGILVEGIANMAQANGFAYTIIVVDDGSTDKTPDIIKELSAKYIILPLENQPNAGLGRTMAKGLKKAAEISADGDIIITLDGDATHDPVYMPPMIERIRQGNDIVIASRFAPGGVERGLSSFRKFLSRGSGTLLTAFFPTKGLRDYTCGYRAFRAEIIKQGFSKFGDGFIRETGFSVTPEILLKLRSLGAKIDEVGFMLKYDQKVGKSKIKVSRTIIQYLKMIIKFKLRGL
ncbi:MAG: dolichol-phosphate mannosyltransferase [Candidatus Aquicultor secundus]|nr:MAG: dolichol-phosphate mannosyltransferase [Candidatus Aquicultor secundus]